MGHPRLAVDGVIEIDGRVLTVIRGQPPFLGMHALPGGGVELGETCEAAILREVLEETGLQAKVDQLVGVYSDPARDPRGHTVSIAYALRVESGVLHAGSDAAGAEFVDPRRLPSMAFDHAKIVEDFLAGGQRAP